MLLRRTTCLIALVAIALATAGTWLASAASADPIADKQAEAKTIQDQIDRNGERISALAEQANGAQYHLDQAEQRIAEAQAKADEARRKAHDLHELVLKRGASAYRGAVSGQSLDDLGGLDVSDSRHLAPRKQYAESAAKHDRDLIDQLHAARQEADKQRTAAEQAREDAKQEKERVAASQRELEAANAQQQQILSQVQGDLQQLVQQEAQRREAQATQEAAVRYAGAVSNGTGGGTDGTGGGTGGGSGSSPGGGSGSFPPPPAPSGGAATAIAFARAQIGRPYCSGGAGPDCYDCSGLTMRAWGAAGVYMPHYSGAQYDMFPHVPLDQMQPGDLVFWGPGGSQHVGLYIGGGQMIAAPHTGDFVKQQAVYGSPVGAVRPG